MLHCPEISRLHRTTQFGPLVEEDRLFTVIDALTQVAQETGRTVAQIALNWLLGRPTVASVIIGARNESQLIDNLGAADRALDTRHRELLDKASAVTVPYPQSMYRSGGFVRLNPPLL